MEYWKAHCQLLGYRPAVNAIQGPKPSGTSPSCVPSTVPQITTTATPIESPEAFTPEALTTSPPSFQTDDPLANNVQENQGTELQTENPNAIENDEENHPASTSTSGPSTPDGLLGNKMAKGSTHRMDKVKVEVEGGSRPSKRKNDLEQILAEIRQKSSSDQAMPLANGEAGSMIISLENGGLLVEILEQNTILREKCADFEKREKHWELKIRVHEQLEKEHLAKITELEKELLALKTVGQLQNSICDAAHVPQGAQRQQLLPLNNVKTEFN